MLKGTQASESEHQITHVLSEFLNENYRVAQKYLAEHEDYKKGRILIPSYEYDKQHEYSYFSPYLARSELTSKNSSKALPSITGKSISATISDIKPKTIDKRSEYLTAAAFGVDIKSLEAADSDSITTASTQLVEHRSNLQQNADLSLDSALQGCVEYAESVIACKKKLSLDDHWDYERDCVKAHFVYVDKEKDHRQSYDRVRLGEVLSFDYAARLVLHVRDTEKKKLETAQNFKATINTVVVPGQTAEKTDYEYSKKYPHILSPNHLHWLCEQLIYRIQNVDKVGSKWKDYKIRNKNEKLENLRAQVTLILTTNIKDYWSSNDLIALLGSVPNLFDEHISANTIKDNYAKAL